MGVLKVFHYYSSSSWSRFYHHWIVVTTNKIRQEKHRRMLKHRASLEKLKRKYVALLSRAGTNMKLVKHYLSIMHKLRVFHYYTRSSWTSFYNHWIIRTQNKINYARHQKMLRHRAAMEKVKARYVRLLHKAGINMK